MVLALQHWDRGWAWSPDCEGRPWGGSCNKQAQHDRGNPAVSFCTTPDEIHDLIAYAANRSNVDRSRIHVTGLSGGAHGIWEYLAEHGDEQVAAAVPIAGDGRPAWRAAGCGLGSVPIWAIHGALDDVVDPHGSIDPITELRSRAGVPNHRAKLSILPGLYHEGWNQAYSGEFEGIHGWMLDFSNPVTALPGTMPGLNAG